MEVDLMIRVSGEVQAGADQPNISLNRLLGVSWYDGAVNHCKL